MPERSQSPLVGAGMLALVALVTAVAILVARPSTRSESSTPEADASAVCDLAGREPTESLTFGPGVVGLVLRCDRPVEPSNISMALDGADLEVATYPGDDGRLWTIVGDTLLTTRGEHVARVEVEAGGHSLAEEWPFTWAPVPNPSPGLDSPPAIAVIERHDGTIDTYAFAHTPDTCGESLTTFFCAPHREIPFTPIQYEEMDFFAGIIPTDATIRPRDTSCFTALAASPSGPDAPREVRLKPMPAPGGTGTVLEWDDVADDESCYVIERALWGQYPAQIQVIATLPAGATSYVDERPYGAPGGVAYRVYAATPDARSAPSEVVAYAFDEPATAASPVCYTGSAVGGAEAPAAPSALEAELLPPVSRGGWGVDLTWEDHADGEFCYVVEAERADGTVETRMLIANTTEEQFSYDFTRTPFEVTYRLYAATETARSEAIEVTVEVPGIPAE